MKHFIKVLKLPAIGLQDKVCNYLENMPLPSEDLVDHTAETTETIVLKNFNPEPSVSGYKSSESSNEEIYSSGSEYEPPVSSSFSGDSNFPISHNNNQSSESYSSVSDENCSEQLTSTASMDSLKVI